MKILRTENLVKVYNKKKVVNQVSIEVHPGEVVGLLGPNGAGKTTTFYMTTGFIAPDEGRVYFEEGGRVHDVTRLPMYKRARLGVAYLPQEASIFRKLTVEENLLAILELTPLSPQDRERRLKELLAELKVSLPGQRLMLRRRRADLAEQELYGLLLVHLALRRLIHDASRHAGCDPDTLSFTHTVRIVRRHLPFHAAFPPSPASPHARADPDRDRGGPGRA